MNAFLPADILLPHDADLQKWAVIACDQFTSDPAYWQRVRAVAGDAPSTVNLIIPEAELDHHDAAVVEKINANMLRYQEEGLFALYPNSYIYVERTLENGSIRMGLMGMVDLDAYDYTVGATSAIRATERTVTERIPPRQRVRRDAPIELPHILLLCDDHEKVLIEPIAAKKDSFKVLYDCDLMEKLEDLAYAKLEYDRLHDALESAKTLGYGFVYPRMEEMKLEDYLVGVLLLEIPADFHIEAQKAQGVAPRVLNLFAYTGGATLAARAAGADITHVDSVKQVVTWSRENMEQSSLEGVRWIVEDALKFVRREVRRGNSYDGIILDPPAYGRGANGEKWVLEENIGQMLECCAALLNKEHGFLVLNLYSMGLSALLARTALRQAFGETGKEEFGELYFTDRSGKELPLGTFCRFYRGK